MRPTVLLVVISVFLSMFGILGVSYYFSDALCNKKERLIPRGWKTWLCCAGVILCNTTVLLMLSLFYHLPEIKIARRVALLSVMWPIAISDYMSFRIPNKLVLSGLVCFLVFTVVELIMSLDGAVSNLAQEVVGLGIIVLICLACMVIAKGSLGMGDLKLMIVMALLLGLEGVFYALFASVFCAFLVSIGLLITKKKKKKDAIPFAPFLLVGTFISTVLSGV